MSLPEARIMQAPDEHAERQGSGIRFDAFEQCKANADLDKLISFRTDGAGDFLVNELGAEEEGL